MKLTQTPEHGGFTLFADGRRITWAPNTEVLEARVEKIERHIADIETCDTFFVYGTLKREGMLNHYMAAYAAEFMAEATVQDYTLFSVCLKFPAMVRSEGQTVRGELWRAPHTFRAVWLLEELDIVENVESGLYSRHLIETSGGPAWSYVWGGSQVGLEPCGEVWELPVGQGFTWG